MKTIAWVVLGVLVGVGVMASEASAVLVANSDNDAFFQNFENLFRDTDGDGTAEWLDPVTVPVVGDYLTGIINVQNIFVNGVQTFLQSTTLQLSGIFAQKILATTIDAGTGILHFTLGNPTLTSFSKGLDTFSTGLAPGEMFAFYLESGLGTTLFEADGTMADDVSKATDGALYLTAGLDATDGAGLDGLFGTADDTGYAYSHPILGANPEGLAFGALDVKFNGTGFLGFAGLNDGNECEVGGFPAEGPGCVGTRAIPLLNHLIFTSEFERNRFGIANPNPTPGTSPWEFQSNDPATIHPLPIPEPSSLWLMGVGLSGLLARRKKKQLAA